MKRKMFLMSALALMIAGGMFWSCQKDDVISEGLMLKSEVTNPLLVDSWSPSGGEKAECELAGNCTEETHAFKVEPWDEETGADGEYDYVGTNAYGEEVLNTITISSSNGKTFNWSSELPVCKVIVKAGTSALIYTVDGAKSGAGLVAPKGKDVSHVTFCFYEEGPGAPECEWIGETAWSAGKRYVTKGNWATYTTYAAGSTVKLNAGQTWDAGTASFSAVVDGKVTITITLNSGFRLEKIDGIIVDEAVKIQGYSTAPSGNPSPGLFSTKGSVLEYTVDAAGFYGIHLNVQREYCPPAEG